MDPNQNTPPPNPYAAPQARVQDPTPGEGELASPWLRLGGAMIDGIILLIITWPLSVALVFLLMVVTGEAPTFVVQVMSVFAAFGVFLAVQGYFLNRSGQTIAKKLLNMKIVDENGQKPAFGRLIALRYAPVYAVQILSYFAVIPLLVDALFIFRDDRRRIVDLIAGTRVVMAE